MNHARSVSYKSSLQGRCTGPLIFVARARALSQTEMLSRRLCLVCLLALPADGFSLEKAPPRPVMRRLATPARHSLIAAADTLEPKGASVPSSTVNLAKNIVGAGVLALASGVSSFSSRRAALPPALAIMLALCSMSGYTFSVIARVGNAVGASSYRDTWAKVFGESSAIIPAFTVTFKTLCGALAYAIIVGDSFASIGKLVGGPALLASSNFMIVLLSVFVFLPLCLMRNLSSLAIGSVIGTAGTRHARNCARHARHYAQLGSYARHAPHAPEAPQPRTAATRLERSRTAGRRAARPDRTPAALATRAARGLPPHAPHRSDPMALPHATPAPPLLTRHALHGHLHGPACPGRLVRRLGLGLALGSGLGLGLGPFMTTLP